MFCIFNGSLKYDIFHMSASVENEERRQGRRIRRKRRKRGGWGEGEMIGT